jgi:hypothetical protein
MKINQPDPVCRLSDAKQVTFGPGYFSDAELERHAIEAGKQFSRKFMSDKTEGCLEVGLNERDEIVINHPDLKLDANGVGHIVFSINQAQRLSHLLAVKASEAANNIRRKREEEQRKAAEAIPVDLSARTLTDGSPVTPDHRELKENGQQKDYVVLSAEERAKGFVRPVRRTYQHIKCGTTTTMSREIAETYARKVDFYDGTYCVACGKHFPLVIDGERQFLWIDDGTAVGT